MTDAVMNTDGRSLSAGRDVFPVTTAAPLPRGAGRCKEVRYLSGRLSMRSGRREPGRGSLPISAGERVAPRSRASSASIAPVGLEFVVDHHADDGSGPVKEEAQQTGPFRIPMQRRRLGGIVVGTVAGCALILIAAVIARVSQASNAPTAPANAAKGASAAGPAVLPGTTWEQIHQAQAPGPSSVATLAQTVGTPMLSDTSATGTVRLSRPGAAGRVWIDGKKLTSTSALVGCGVHKIKVGMRARERSVEVPCGGELVISK
jgi:hypothetical protein